MKKKFKDWRNTIVPHDPFYLEDEDLGYEELFLDDKEKVKKKLVVGSIEELKGLFQDQESCPQVHEVTRVCVCVDCPKKEGGKCWPEKLCKSSGCGRGGDGGYILSCSLRSEVASGTSPLFGKFVCEEWSHHIRKKFDIPR